MAPKRTRERLERDRTILCRALKDYEAGTVTELDELERVRIAESIARRIAELDAKIEAFGRE
jgi:hypothetical protein